MDTTETRINILLDKVRPYVQTHGGDVQLLRVEDGVAYLKTYGACVDCTLSTVTYTKTVGPLIVKEVPEVIEVVFE
jgi:Fe-S cluster biogenesis protein NfuA